MSVVQARDTPRLLLVEDDDALAALVVEYLTPHGFDVRRVGTGSAGADAILSGRPDLVVLDLMLPELNGLDVLRRVRTDYTGIIMMLTASQSEADHVAGLELGADDFITKPIDPRVLLARIRTQLPRHRGAPPRARTDGVLRVGAIHIDVGARDVCVGTQPVSLTTMEFDVLHLLAERAGSVVGRDDLYRTILGIDYDGLDRGMDVHVSRIRKKLEPAGWDTTRLKAVRGVGYLLAAR
ncbi:MAG: response regulator transcription factor [Sandaracinaceae bacterium]